ncbi:MAG: hypothetical protein GEV03_22760 [Streptosporangiales bacterium]|nr:hypothetical protein [Streptosporangiales bacterium]
MSIQVPTEFGWLFPSVVGDNWPSGDEDMLRKCADAWRRAGKDVRDEEESAWQLTRQVAGTMEGEAADASRVAIDGLVSADEQSLRELAETCDRLAEICEQYAQRIEETKLAIIEQLASLDTTAVAALSLTSASNDASLASLAGQLSVARERVRASFEGLLRHAVEAESSLHSVGEFEDVRIAEGAAPDGAEGYVLAITNGEPLEGLAPVPEPPEGADDQNRPPDAGATEEDEKGGAESPAGDPAVPSQVGGEGGDVPGTAPTSPAVADAPAPGAVSAGLDGGGGSSGGATSPAYSGPAYSGGTSTTVTGGPAPTVPAPPPPASAGGGTVPASVALTSPAGSPPLPGAASPPRSVPPSGSPGAPGSVLGAPGTSGSPGPSAPGPGGSGGLGGDGGGGVARFGDTGGSRVGDSPGRTDQPWHRGREAGGGPGPGASGRTVPGPDRGPLPPPGDPGSRPRGGRPPFVWLINGVPHRPEYAGERRKERATAASRAAESSRRAEEYGRADFYRAGWKRVEELTDLEAAAFQQLHREAAIDETTVMQKIITPWQAECCLENTVHSIGGFAVRWEDVTLCRDPAELQEAFGLGGREPDGKRPFHPDDPVIHLLRFPALDPEAYKRPFGGRDPDHAELYRATWGLPSVRDVEMWSYPFTGTGFTGSQRRVVPAFLLKEDLPVPNGAEMYQLTDDGDEDLLAVYVAVRGWVAVLDDGPGTEDR